MPLGVLVAFDDLLVGDLFEASLCWTPLPYRIGFPLGLWIMRNETASSVETAGQSLTGMRTRDRLRLPDQRDGGAIGRKFERYNCPNLVARQSDARGTKVVR